MTTHEVILPLFSPMATAGAEHKRYRTLVADPPWGYRDKLGGPQERGAEGHYGTMTMPELYSMPVGLWAENDALLWLWTTNAFMVEAHKLAEGWGFTPRTIMTWIKGRLIIENHEPKLIQQIGMGHFLRNSTEHIVLAVRGKIDVRNHDVPSAFIAPRLEHSEKPAAFYDMVERMSPGPYLDVFARKQRLRWDTFGNEAFDFREHGVFNNG